jgi:glyceraldehyde 3-phosphate dehydrogenase
MVMEVVPELKGRVTGSAVAVPVRNGSAVDLVCWHSRKVTSLAVNEVVRTAASTERWKRVIDYEDEPIVSSDVARSAWSSTFDSLATMVLGEKVSKTISWYDSGFGYAHRAVDLLERFAKLDRPAGAPR